MSFSIIRVAKRIATIGANFKLVLLCNWAPFWTRLEGDIPGPPLFIINSKK